MGPHARVELRRLGTGGGVQAHGPGLKGPWTHDDFITYDSYDFYMCMWILYEVLMIDISIYIYIYMYIHTYKHIYIYIYI